MDFELDTFKPFFNKSLEEVTACARKGDENAQLFLGGLYYKDQKTLMAGLYGRILSFQGIGMKKQR